MSDIPSLRQLYDLYEPAPEWADQEMARLRGMLKHIGELAEQDHARQANEIACLRAELEELRTEVEIWRVLFDARGTAA